MANIGGQRLSENQRPWTPRRDAIVPEAGFDPYRLANQFPEPTVCLECRSTYEGGRWHRAGVTAVAAAGANQQICPACGRIKDGYPAGFLTLSGQFQVARRDEILALLRTTETAEQDEHPLNRIIKVDDQGDEIQVTTTDVHLPRRIAEAIHDAFGGTLRLDYADEDTLVRVLWYRDDVPAAEIPAPETKPLIEVQRNDLVVTPEAEAYLEERLAHLASFYPRILSTRVVFEAPTGHHRTGGPFSVNIFLDVPGDIIAVTHQHTENLHTAMKAAFDAAQRRLEDFAREQRGDVSPTVKPTRARIIRLMPAEDHGFLIADDGHELYFHRHSVVEGDFDRLEVGMEVRFAEEAGERGMQATTVAPLG